MCLLLVKVFQVFNVFQSFGPHLALLVTTYILCEVKLSNLQRSSEELPLDGRQIHENSLIKMMAPSLIQILGHWESP